MYEDKMHEDKMHGDKMYLDRERSIGLADPQARRGGGGQTHQRLDGRLTRCSRVRTLKLVSATDGGRTAQRRPAR